MSNVNFYPQNPPIKSEPPLNSNYIQKILDENVSLIHTIMERQQQHHTAESEELLKSLHKNLIYLATIADQTTSSGGPPTSGLPVQNPYSYIAPGSQGGVPNQSYSGNASAQGFIQGPPAYAGTPAADIIDKKPPQQFPEEDSVNRTSDFSTGFNVDMDREAEKMAQSVKDTCIKPPESTERTSLEPSKDMTSQKSAGNIHEVPSVPKSEENISGQTQNGNIKTDMPPPSQPPLGVHNQDKTNPNLHYGPNQRFGYPQAPPVNPNFNQYPGPHFDQNSKFYPPQNPYQQQQQSPYNYQGGMYNPYQPIPISMAPNHYNQQQHMLNSAPMYPQYPQYYQQPAMDHINTTPKDPSMVPSMMHPSPNSGNQQMKPPISETQPPSSSQPMTE